MIPAEEEEDPDALMRVYVEWAVDTFPNGVERVTATWARITGCISERQLSSVQRLVGRPMSKAQMQEFLVD